MALGLVDWTPEVVDRLRALWGEGHSTAEIGRRMDISKSAVIGKAHRLNLPARPSPIRRSADGRKRPEPQPPVIGAKPTLPGLTSLGEAVGQALALVPVIARTAVAVHERVVAVARKPGGRPCCWPIGEPGTKDFRFCDAEADRGFSYCGEHRARAYAKPREAV